MRASVPPRAPVLPTPRFEHLPRARHGDSNALFVRCSERVRRPASGRVPTLSSCRANSSEPRVFPSRRGFADQTPAASRSQPRPRRRGTSEAPPAAKTLSLVLLRGFQQVFPPCTAALPRRARSLTRNNHGNITSISCYVNNSGPVQVVLHLRGLVQECE